MRRLDRWMLATSYVLLVAVVAFLAFDVDRRLTRNEQVLCETAWAQAALSLGTFSVVVQDVEDPTFVEVINTQFALIDSLRETCGPEPFDLPEG